jgi:hypothetical protein
MRQNPQRQVYPCLLMFRGQILGIERKLYKIELGQTRLKPVSQERRPVEGG